VGSPARQPYNENERFGRAMCLATPGVILAITTAGPAEAATPHAAPLTGQDSLWRSAEVDFGGVRQQVSLACLPEARVGDRVLVHVGVALSLVHDADQEHDPRSLPSTATLEPC
jgi:hydrogenase expression/formation protein HypC